MQTGQGRGAKVGLGDLFGFRKFYYPTKRYELFGVEDADKILKDFWNTINSTKVSLNILKDSDVEVGDMGGKTIVCIHVPQADWREKPIFLNENVYKGTFKRNHAAWKACSE